MTITEIKSMFAPGQQWRVQRTGKPVTIVGNLGNTVLPAIDCDERRAVKRVMGKQLVTTMPEGRDCYTDWPKAGEIIEAKPGLLKFQYTNGPTVTLTKI